MNLYEVSVNPFGISPSGHFKVFALSTAKALAKLADDPRFQKLTAEPGFEIRLFNSEPWVLSEDPNTNGFEVLTRVRRGSGRDARAPKKGVRK